MRGILSLVVRSLRGARPSAFLVLVLVLATACAGEDPTGSSAPTDAREPTAQSMRPSADGDATGPRTAASSFVSPGEHDPGDQDQEPRVGSPPSVAWEPALMRQAWRVYYAASGQVEGRQGPAVRTYEAPPEMHLIWDPARLSLGLGGLSAAGWDRQAADEDRYYMGVRFGIADLARGDLAEFYVTAPIDGGSSTIGFAPRDAPLPFFGLDVGDEHADATNDGRYVFSTSRPDATTWRIALEPREGGPDPVDSFHSATFTFRVDDVALPWRRLELQIEGTSRYGAASGVLDLRLHADHERATPPPR